MHALRHGLEAAIEKGGEKGVGGGLGVYVDRVSASVRGFVEEHPVVATMMVSLLALAIIGLVAPQLLAILGFSAEGPVAGMFLCALDSIITLCCMMVIAPRSSFSHSESF